MSLLLDALKKAAEKKKQETTATDSTDTQKSAESVAAEQTKLQDTLIEDLSGTTRSDPAASSSADTKNLQQDQLLDTQIGESFSPAADSDSKANTREDFADTQMTQINLSQTSDSTEPGSASRETSDPFSDTLVSGISYEPVAPPKETPESPELEKDTVLDTKAHASDDTSIDDVDTLVSGVSSDQAKQDSSQTAGSSPDLEKDTLIDVDEFTLSNVDERGSDDTSILVEGDTQTNRVNYASDPQSLTTDDVTEFMGDGLFQDDSELSIEIDDDGIDTSVGLRPLNDDDDTALNDTVSRPMVTPELEQAQWKSENEVDTVLSGESDSTVTSSVNIRRSFDEDASTVKRSDSTSTSSSVRLEDLTSDHTVTIGDSGSRVPAQDNYDRTLISISDKDASRLFAGMKPDESGVVMTPDYAKQIFKSKSGQTRTDNAKKYVALAVFAFLLIVVVGLFQLQEEMQQIDNNLVSLKRDPLPRGVTLNPAVQDDKSPQPVNDLKTLDVLATAETPATDALTNAAAEASAESQLEQEAVDEALTEESLKPELEQFEEVTSDSETSAETETLQSQPIKPIKQTAKTVKVAKQPAQKRESSAVNNPQISQVEQPLQKDQLLLRAYEAYESGNLLEASQGYAAVLEIDPENRDALLGSAAIMVKQNRYSEAIVNYQSLLLANPKDPVALASLISVSNIEPQTGETEIKKLLQQQPGAAYLYFVLGNMYGGQSRWTEAQSAYFEALKGKPQNPDYAYNLAVSLEHLGKSGHAVRYYQMALENVSASLSSFDPQLVAQRIEVLTQ